MGEGGWGRGEGGGSRIILDIYIYIYIYIHEHLANRSVEIANGSVPILNFAGSVPPASEINFAGPKT